MSAAVLSRPPLAVLSEMGRRIMDVILHIGAQRTATTTLQAYLRSNAADLAGQGTGLWGPLRTRKGGLLSGVLPPPDAGSAQARLDLARARVQTRLDATARRGLHRLIVSDENMLGTVRRTLRAQALYPDAHPRLERFASVFDGAVTRVVLAIRGLDKWWASAWAFGVCRGEALPGTDDVAAIAARSRSWRDVVQDVAAAFPAAEIQVQTHETLAGRPDRRLWHMTGGKVAPPRRDAGLWLHRAPCLAELRAALGSRGQGTASLPEGDGIWRPFDDRQTAQLRETHADDLFWLTAGAGGLATLIKEDQPDQAGQNLPGGATTRGHRHDRQEGRLARAG